MSAGAANVKRQHMGRLQHNKMTVVNGPAVKAVVCGSTSFSWRGRPLITVTSSPTLGGNVNGPTVIRVPPWVERPMGKYYMYFAHHLGEFVRLAYADAVTGPWTIHDPGVLHVKDTAFFRAQPDPPETRADFYTHVASSDILIDHGRRRVVMWVHGWWSNGEQRPPSPPAARAWAREKGYGQFTQVAESTDGGRFTVRPAITVQVARSCRPSGRRHHVAVRSASRNAPEEDLEAVHIAGFVR